MTIENLEIVNDGQTVERKFVNDWDIVDFCNPSNVDYVIKFTGVVIQNKRALFSFPKHYNVNRINGNFISSMKQILYILSKMKATYGSFDKGIKGEFPIKAYLEIINYYKKFGLYSSKEKYFKLGYEGKIDWTRTINQVNKIVQKNGIVYCPFTTSMTRDKSVFISECMNFVMDDASQYKDLITVIIPYRYSVKNRAFDNLRFVSKKLKELRNTYFKDSEKRLINGLIEYFDWKSNSRDNFKLLTVKFEDYWEMMIHKYLNDCFFEIRENSIIWKQGSNKSFHKPKKEYVESNFIINNAIDRTPFKIQYDHILFDNEKRLIVLFDSKYFNNEVDELNYKQLFYHYNLMQKYPGYSIEDGLLLPTEKNYYSKVHIDRVDLDGVKIIEHYINLDMVLNHYTNTFSNSGL